MVLLRVPELPWLPAAPSAATFRDRSRPPSTHLPARGAQGCVGCPELHQAGFLCLLQAHRGGFPSLFHLGDLPLP